MIEEGSLQTVNGRSFRIGKLLGKGKGGYCYLAVAEDDGKEYVFKQIHHEPCEYYQFGNKIDAERNDHNRLFALGIRMPKLIDIDDSQERLIKEFIKGPTIAQLAEQNGIKQTYIDQVKEMCQVLYASNTNIDYYPNNFIVRDELLYYVDYECNNYMDEWNFENWGCKYWVNADGSAPK